MDRVNLILQPRLCIGMMTPLANQSVSLSELKNDDGMMDQTVLRILDANFNRAREGLRVLEEYARLVLQDAALCMSVKQLRHALAEVAQSFHVEIRLSSRDIQGDVGTQISTAAESQRRNARAVAQASAKRLTESLRCIEEYGKIVDCDAAAKIEHLRYQAYALEQNVFVTSQRQARLRRARVHVLMTESLCRGDWQDVSRKALSGGADVLQLREKSLCDRELLEHARLLRQWTREHQALLIINDRPDIARLVDADGVHVGQSDLPISDVRQIIGPTRLVGISTHTAQEAKAALQQGPDYVAVGPMFRSGTKPDAAAQGPALLKNVIDMAHSIEPQRMPVVAIGGITIDNISELIRELGSEAYLQVAVCQGVIASDDPAGTVRAMKSRM